ncbi:hypothetical protein [Arthrobacter sp. Leaf137]|uniref:hypothetical protein n=1 Tax=Arthrobacter sp. Leaf137 TaxID=1736271 RepID=UPI00138F17F4|nr:hypothetical protein [Arthrobacter sp. Leaf137]
MLIEPPTSENDWEKLGLWLQDKQRLSADRNSYQLDSKSLLALDQQGMPAGTSVAAVVRSLLDSAVDDLASAFALVNSAGRPSPVGIPTLVRGSIELAGVGMWVLTATGRAGRQERALRVAHDSLINGKKFFTHLSQEPTAPPETQKDAAVAAKNHDSQVRNLIASCSFLGIEKKLVTRPLSRTDALKQVDKARKTTFFSEWQLCSGFAHGFSWAPQFFHDFLYTHTMEGGGTLTGRTMGPERTLTTLHWGQHAINELLGSFNQGRRPAPPGAGMTILAMPPIKPET